MNSIEALYTQEQIAYFNEMHRILEEYNKLGAQSGKIPDEMPPFTDEDMIRYSQYQQRLLAYQVRMYIKETPTEL